MAESRIDPGLLVLASGVLTVAAGQVAIRAPRGGGERVGNASPFGPMS